jgi:aminopeptidase-like protein
MEARTPDPTRTDGDQADIGQAIYNLACDLFPICRSLTGQGVRDTLDLLGRTVDLERHAVATGTPLFDWVVPPEWVIRDAFIKAPDGKRVLDFARSNLHVVGYSMPIRRLMDLAELKRHIFTLPEQPDLIPYRTSYYGRDWGFCMSHNQLTSLPDAVYEVCIDSELAEGQLDYGEYVHPGCTDDEILLTTHICHPSLANDNCSGMALLATLAGAMRGRDTRHTYRFLFAPGTLGPLAWLSANEDRVGRVKHGMAVSCVGDGGGPTYKRSRRDNAIIDRVMTHILSAEGDKARSVPFSPYGYDERQFCSPGFDMPFGLFQNSAFGTFPQYHTSADNMDFIRPEHLARSYRIVADAIEILEADWTPINLNPKGEPQLGQRGLYASVGGPVSGGQSAMPILWVLNLADGRHSLIDIAERSGLPFRQVIHAARVLRENGLLRPA